MKRKALTVEEIDDLLKEGLPPSNAKPLDAEGLHAEDEVKCEYCKSSNVVFVRISEVEEHFFCAACERKFSFLRRDMLI